MRILHTILTRGMAGTERYVADLCNQQVKTNPVAILVRSDHQLDNGLTFLSWLSPEVIVLLVPKQYPLPWILWHVFRWKPDIIHSHHKRDAKYIGRYVSKVTKIGTLHIEYQDAFGRCDGLVCISSWQREGIPAEFSGVTETVFNWVPALRKADPNKVNKLRAELGIPESAYVVGAVGRFAKEKGLGLLVNAFLEAGLPESYLVIIGDGPEREALLRRSCPNVILPGITAEVAQYYGLFDLFVLPSLFEPFGLVLLEAMSMGLPVISTKTEGPREMLSSVKGAVLVETGDVVELSKAIKQAYIERSLVSKPIQYDLQRFERELQIGKIESVYKRALNGT
ncbi:glycosyltransferase [Neptunomonas sp.]|uniref:glycosyltransferase n=1 Tax=Neptunomonas sp. TaxID=1971898 RepID=UPI0025E16E51|nr:glycosyltransferase [Neptunomonas sp.]